MIAMWLIFNVVCMVLNALVILIYIYRPLLWEADPRLAIINGFLLACGAFTCWHLVHLL